jgi:predicted TIM-barrel fold metal-dependent hydrolase
LLVGPNSGYGEDNRCLLDTLERGAGRYRGMAVVPISTSRAELAELAELQARGIVGITLNAALPGTDRYADAGRLLRDLAALDMIADVQVTGNQLLELSPVLEPSGGRILVDHCGRPDPAAGLDAPGFRELLRWGRTGRAFVKLSGLAKASREPYPHEDLEPFVRALLDEFGPGHCVWGSDWPFLRASEHIDYAPLLDLLTGHVSDSDDRQRILCTTPRHLLGF